MPQNKNKNKSVGVTKLLKMVYRKKQFTWTSILFNIVFIANIFKDCLIYLHNKEVYILTLTSAELLVRLQEASIRKASEIEDINMLYNNYGNCHTYAIFWTVKGNAKVLPHCLETSRLFEYIAKETTGTQLKSSSVTHVEYDGLISDNQVYKRKLQKKGPVQLYTVNVVNDLFYDKHDDYPGRRKAEEDSGQRNTFRTISLSRKPKNKVNVTFSKWFQEETVCPFTRTENERCEFPQQISGEQESEGQSTIVFSNGAAFRPLPGHQYGSVSSSNQTAVPTAVADRAIPRYPSYINREVRIRSYDRWTHRKPDKTQLSDAGFFFTGLFLASLYGVHI